MFSNNHTLALARAFLVVFISSGLLIGCASNKPEVNMVDEENFKSINTFFVQPPLNPVNVPVENHVVSSISSILLSKGLSPASKDNADIEVTFFPSSAIKDNGKSMSIGLGTGVFGRSSAISLGSIFNIPVGEQVTQYQNLQIDIIQNGEFIYSAAGSTELEAKDSITIQKELTNLVHELLRPYPAKSVAPAETN
ncbi:DUF4136 domain-containing protein [Alteromonas ponticola]|uniref:DUF4136 domain-containing protein n=1 Tax=Alteromonas ponticola TaxID=2720613 RepID=A0ABX1R187_9ALTE|nr:DUF4136 domain-containing protein [Alteromonas ponticola]NMH59513.1 DUF4136 domain-containing protein [Alteromonas ponticola]